MSPNNAHNNLEEWEKKVERRSLSRKKKGKPGMKVSGASVKTLARIIKEG